VASAWCGFLASAAFLLNNRRDAIFCKVSRKKATHLENSRSNMIESKETIDQNESKLIGATSLLPIVDRFYGPLYQFVLTVFTDRFTSLLFVLPGANRMPRTWFSRLSSR
jgi:hypothetical protein